MGFLDKIFDREHYEEGVTANLKSLKEALKNPVKKCSEADILQISALMKEAHGGQLPESGQELLNLLKNPEPVYARAAKAIEEANNGWQKFVGFFGFGHINDLADACSYLVAMQLAVKALHEEKEPIKIGDKETTNRLSDISSAVYIFENPNHGIFKDIVRNNFDELLTIIPAASKKAAEPVAAAPVAVKDEGKTVVVEKAAPAPAKVEPKQEPNKTEVKTEGANHVNASDGEGQGTGDKGIISQMRAEFENMMAKFEKLLSGEAKNEVSATQVPVTEVK